MKKIIPVLIFAFFSSGSVFGKDIKQGAVSIGGGLELSAVSTNINENQTANGLAGNTQVLSLSTLYYFLPNLGAGILWENRKKETLSGGVSSTSKENATGAQISYNISLGGNVSIAPILSLGVSSSESTGGGSDYLLTGSFWGASVDFSYFINNNFSIGPSIGYLSFSEDDSVTQNRLSYSGFGVSFGLSVYLGA